MNSTNFFEVIDYKGRWAASYSKELDRRGVNQPSAKEMAQITARHCGGEVVSVSFDNEREIVWPTA